jgi:hypothetical protein
MKKLILFFLFSASLQAQDFPMRANIVPGTTNTYDLGKVNKYWDSVFTRHILVETINGFIPRMGMSLSDTSLVADSSVFVTVNRQKDSLALFAHKADLGTAAQMDSTRVMTLDKSQTVTRQMTISDPSSVGIYASSVNSYGIQALSTNSRGISAQGGTRGVDGYSVDGTGVYGYSSTSYGVYGVSSSGNGVYGTSSSNYGVVGVQTGGSYPRYGLYTSGSAFVGDTARIHALELIHLLDSLYLGQHDHLQSEVIALSDSLAKYVRKTDSTVGTSGRYATWDALRDSTIQLSARIGSGTGTANPDSSYLRVETDSLVALSAPRKLAVGRPGDSVFVRNLYAAGGQKLFDESGVPWANSDTSVTQAKVISLISGYGVNVSGAIGDITLTADTTNDVVSKSFLTNRLLSVVTSAVSGFGVNVSGATGAVTFTADTTNDVVSKTFLENRLQWVTGTTGSTGDTVNTLWTQHIKSNAHATVTIDTTLEVNGVYMQDGDTLITRSGKWKGAPMDSNSVVMEEILHRGWGGIYIDDADPDTMSTTTVNIFKTVKGWTTGGVLYGASVQDSSITIQNAGTYEIRWKTTIDGANYGDDSQFNGYAYVDDVKQTKSGDKISLHNSLDLKTLGGFCLVNLTAGQIVKVKIAPASAADPSGTVYIRYANLVVTRIN